MRRRSLGTPRALRASCSTAGSPPSRWSRRGPTRRLPHGTGQTYGRSSGTPGNIGP
jgi:hypothetical protein